MSLDSPIANQVIELQWDMDKAKARIMHQNKVLSQLFGRAWHMPCNELYIWAYSQSGHHVLNTKTQGLCFCYLSTIKSKWNKFKWEILDNSNYDNFHGSGDFSHTSVIMHKYLGKKPEMQKMNS
jgi:hypothetical protein